MNLINCACGCNQKIFPKDLRGRTKKYIWGHGPRTNNGKYKNATEKICTKCMTIKPISDFYITDKPSNHCKKCRSSYYKERTRNRTPEKRMTIRNQRNKNYKDLKDDILREYGGKCECCGEIKTEFLTVDHIHGGGCKHRRQIGSGGFFWSIRKENFPKDKYRLLCMNCNFSLGRHGYCPHNLKGRV